MYEKKINNSVIIKYYIPMSIKPKKKYESIYHYQQLIISKFMRKLFLAMASV